LTRVVVDANVVVKWLLPEDLSHAAARLLAPGYELWAPDLVWAEVGYIFWKKWGAVRGGYAGPFIHGLAASDSGGGNARSPRSSGQPLAALLAQLL
jgi:hypothetical protein